jgi:hypothetical protein
MVNIATQKAFRAEDGRVEYRTKCEVSIETEIDGYGWNLLFHSLFGSLLDTMNETD